MGSWRTPDTAADQVEALAAALATHLETNEALRPKNSDWICGCRGHVAKQCPSKTQNPGGRGGRPPSVRPKCKNRIPLG